MPCEGAQTISTEVYEGESGWVKDNTYLGAFLLEFGPDTHVIASLEGKDKYILALFFQDFKNAEKVSGEWKVILLANYHIWKNLLDRKVCGLQIYVLCFSSNN